MLKTDLAHHASELLQARFGRWYRSTSEREGDCTRFKETTVMRSEGSFEIGLESSNLLQYFTLIVQTRVQSDW